MNRIGVFFCLFFLSSTSLLASYLPTERDLYEFSNWESSRDFCKSNPPVKIKTEDRSGWDRKVFLDFLKKSAESISGRKVVSSFYFDHRNKIWHLDEHESYFLFNVNGDLLEYDYDPEDTVTGWGKNLRSCI